MATYKNLFVPVDGSELSNRAMEAAIDLAVQLGARITGFVAEPDMPVLAGSRDPRHFAENQQKHEARNAEHAQSLLGKFEQRCAERGVPFSGASATGAADAAIAEEAERQGCDMIVMVTNGRGPVGEFIFGSTTKKVISKTSLPVLVLH